MQVTYSGEHSILVGDPISDQFDENNYIDTWRDWHLIPKEVPIISPPKVQTDLVQIPGTNGSVDLTDALLGYPLYDNRAGSLEFYVDTSETGWSWDIAYDTIMNDIHGFKKRLILKDVPSWFYEGRLSVNQFRSERVTSSIVIDYDFAPFKRMLFTTAFDDWLWNPFDFVNGIIPDKNMFIKTLDGGSTSELVELPSPLTGIMPVVPTIKAIVLGEVDWTAIGDQLPSFSYKLNGDNTQYFEYFSSNDKQDISSGISIIEHYNPQFTVGRPVPGYSISYQFENKFKDAGGNLLPATFYLDFRPGRL